MAIFFVKQEKRGLVENEVGNDVCLFVSFSTSSSAYPACKVM